jgi:hypothetical protein
MNSKNGNIKIANNLILSHMGKDGTNLYGKIQLFFSYFPNKRHKYGQFLHIPCLLPRKICVRFPKSSHATQPSLDIAKQTGCIVHIIGHMLHFFIGLLKNLVFIFC